MFLQPLADWVKDSPLTLYMPPWSLEETLTARCLYSATEARVRLLHSKWGGLARYTLKFASFDEVEQVQLEKAFSKVRASKVVEAVLSDSDIPHKLIHLVYHQPITRATSWHLLQNTSPRPSHD
jgi:hypothetical protein